MCFLEIVCFQYFCFQYFCCAITSYFPLYLLLWAELCPLRIHMLKLSPPSTSECDCFEIGPLKR